jgi:hypothetical protein
VRSRKTQITSSRDWIDDTHVHIASVEKVIIATRLKINKSANASKNNVIVNSNLITIFGKNDIIAHGSLVPQLKDVLQKGSDMEKKIAQRRAARVRQRCTQKFKGHVSC